MNNFRILLGEKFLVGIYKLFLLISLPSRFFGPFNIRRALLRNDLIDNPKYEKC
jgi:hypothetical protein